ncbi:TetR/AcrR family transcriptional regulator [Pseudoduganella violaceinigra]|uniref:TetR/AcrR family transcriptional regulator n=1 Tax=Pseudoduganella violaceinigra TaxID=246602 RepID=UPI0004244D29|nr:TetR/AcrR family transcriptional regulator [Pseudoduganella violaceinigra]
MPAKTNDHRPRVAAERRERMRQRLIESAMIVFAEKGVGASVIPDVRDAAGVSQGSFYNYFRSNEELLIAVAEELSGEMVQLIEPVVGDIADPARRVATGMRCYLHLARAHRLLARFLSAAGLRMLRQHNDTFRYLPDDLTEGQKQGVFTSAPLDIVLDMVAGAGLAALDRMARSRVPKDYPDQVIAALMRMLGMPAAAAEQVASGPLPKLTPAADSLLARAQARAASQVDAAA